jgi:hypothetical protein
MFKKYETSTDFPIRVAWSCMTYMHEKKSVVDELYFGTNEALNWNIFIDGVCVNFQNISDVL